MDQTNHDPTDEAALSLGGAVLDDAALDELLQQVVQLALLTVEGAHAVSITVADQGGYRTSNSTMRGCWPSTRCSTTRVTVPASKPYVRRTRSR